MPIIPLEIKGLIVHELARDPKSLSAISYVWPETIPYIRDHRFKNLEFYGFDSLSRFLAVLARAPAILPAIHSIFFTVPFQTVRNPSPMTSQYTKLITLVRKAPNLEELFMSTANLSTVKNVLSSIPSSSHSSIKLKTLTLQTSHTCTLAALLDIIRSFPHLTTLSLLNMVIMDLHQISRHIGTLSANPSGLRPELWIRWDTHGFEAPEQIPQLTSLSIRVSYASDLMFLDLLASPKTPFPNLEEFTLEEYDLPMCRPRCLPALLDRYKDTLRVLDLVSGDYTNQTPVLKLPPTLEHFKVTIVNTMFLDNLCETLSLSSSSLRKVSINCQSSFILPDPPSAMDALDKVLAGMPGLETLDITVWMHLEKEIKEGFRRCLGKQAEGRVKVVWHVK